MLVPQFVDDLPEAHPAPDQGDGTDAAAAQNINNEPNETTAIIPLVCFFTIEKT